MGPLIPLFWTSDRVSKPEWAALVALGGGILYDVHSQIFTSGVTPADLLVGDLPHSSLTR